MYIQGPFSNAIIISVDYAFVQRAKYSIDVFFLNMQLCFEYANHNIVVGYSIIKT